LHKLLLQFLYSQCTTVSAVSVLTADYTATDYYNVPIECIHVLRIFYFWTISYSCTWEFLR